MIKNTHYLLAPVLSVMGRFKRTFTDEEFQAFAEVGLPDGWQAVHVEEGQNIDNSPKVQALAQYPVIVEGSTGRPVDPIMHLMYHLTDYYDRYADAASEIEKRREWAEVVPEPAQEVARVPNLDKMTADQLTTFCLVASTGSARLARELFPDKMANKLDQLAAVTAVGQLILYARKRQRSLAADISGLELRRETLYMEAVYQHLSAWAKFREPEPA